MAEYNSRIKLKRDTSANWTASDPVLLDGEMVIVQTSNGSTRKKVGDGTKKYSQLPFDDEAILSEVAGKSEKSTSVSATLTASGWSSSGSQTISVSGLGASQNGMLSLGTSEQAKIQAATDAKLCITSQSEGALTITAYGTVPTEDIPVVVVMIG